MDNDDDMVEIKNEEPDIYLFSEQDDKELIRYLIAKQTEYLYQKNYTDCRYKFKLFLSKLARFKIVFLRFLCLTHAILIFFINSFEITKSVGDSLDNTLLNSLWLTLIFCILQHISDYYHEEVLHHLYYSRVTFSKRGLLSWYEILELLLYIIIIISSNVSIEGFHEKCEQNLDDCQILWKTFHQLFSPKNESFG